MKTILFDFDGTLADTLDVAFELWNELAEAEGYLVITPEEIPELQHLKAKKLFRKLGVPKRKVPGLLLRGTRELGKRIDLIELVSGLRPVLQVARKEASVLGILTSNSVENVERFLRRQGLEDSFDLIVSTSKLTKKATHLRRIMKNHNLSPSEVIYVGDEIRDIVAAHKAKVASVAVTWGFNSRSSLVETKPTFVADTPAQLLEALQS